MREKEIEATLTERKKANKIAKKNRAEYRTEINNLIQEKKMSEEIIKTFRNFHTIKAKAASDKELQIKNMQKCVESKQETNEKMSKENEELKKEKININPQLQQRKEEITKKVKEDKNLKEEIKIMNKEQIQQKRKVASERERNQNIIKDLERAKRELEKQNATLRTINLELETKLHSSNRHLNNKKSNNCHPTVETKESQYIIYKENSKENSTQSYSIYLIDILSERIKEQDLLEKLHEKQDLQDINIRKDRNGKEGNIVVILTGTEESAQAAIGEINKRQQYTAKKLGQNNRENMRRTESTKEQNMVNQVVKQCYACKESRTTKRG